MPRVAYLENDITSIWIIPDQRVPTWCLTPIISSYFAATKATPTALRLHCRDTPEATKLILTGFRGGQASLVDQMIKNLPAMQETWVRSLGQEDALKEGMASHSIILAWRIPWTEEPSGLQSMGSQKSWT